MFKRRAKTDDSYRRAQDAKRRQEELELVKHLFATLTTEPREHHLTKQEYVGLCEFLCDRMVGLWDE